MKDKIVVFDSGLGGLNIYKTLKEKYPNENYIYLADELYLPYGTKSIDFLKERIGKIIEHFKEAKAIIIACNTASSIYSLLDLNYPNVFEIIEVTSIYTNQISKNKNIGIIATNLTIELGKYHEYLTKLKLHPFSLKYSELVEIIESKNNYHEKEYQNILDTSLKEKLAYFKDKNIDTLICGCTHFGYLIEEYKKYLGNINYIVSDEAVVNYVKKHIELNSKEKGTSIVYTTGDVLEFQEKLKLYSYQEDVKKIII